MQTIPKLTAQARETAEYRGHLLGVFTSEDTTAHAQCMACGKEVFVNLRPLPNDVELGGEVLAVNCPARKTLHIEFHEHPTPKE